MKDSGSFRDPSSHVYILDNRIFRGCKRGAEESMRLFLQSPFFKENNGRDIVKTREIKKEEIIEQGLDSNLANQYALWLEHERINFLSYPYEWSFNQLKRAACFHLALQLRAIKSGFQLRDASAYNVQFSGNMPTFIDLPSFELYREGEPWIAYRQFCQMFLAPLVLQAKAGVDVHSWLRGSLDGIDIISCSRLLPLKTYLDLNIIGHIHAHAVLARKINATSKKKNGIPARVSQKNLVNFIGSLKKYISRLENRKESYWKNYEYDNSYSDELLSEKKHIVSSFVNSNKINYLLDIGCNTGTFSEIALSSGAKNVIGIDTDSGALDIALTRPGLRGRNFHPLLYDLANPSPDLGWRLKERKSLKNRLPHFEASICLALIHHLVIGRNIPMVEFIDLLLELAPRGLIEFVKKEDQMVKALLQSREDIFSDYTTANFEKYFSERASLKRIASNNSSRIYYEFYKK